MGASPDGVAEAVAACIHRCSRRATPSVVPAGPVDEVHADWRACWFAHSTGDADLARPLEHSCRAAKRNSGPEMPERKCNEVFAQAPGQVDESPLVHGTAPSEQAVDAAIERGVFVVEAEVTASCCAPNSDAANEQRGAEAATEDDARGLVLAKFVPATQARVCKPSAREAASDDDSDVALGSRGVPAFEAEYTDVPFPACPDIRGKRLAGDDVISEMDAKIKEHDEVVAAKDSAVIPIHQVDYVYHLQTMMEHGKGDVGNAELITAAEHRTDDCTMCGDGIACGAVGHAKLEGRLEVEGSDSRDISTAHGGCLVDVRTPSVAGAAAALDPPVRCTMAEMSSPARSRAPKARRSRQKTSGTRATTGVLPAGGELPEPVNVVDLEPEYQQAIKQGVTLEYVLAIRRIELGL